MKTNKWVFAGILISIISFGTLLGIYIGESLNLGLKEIEDAKDNYEVVLVDFWAEGCKPCRMIAPFIEEIEDEYPSIKVLSVDINSEDGLREKYGIRWVPTVIIFNSGVEFTRLVGYHEKEEYTRELNRVLNPDASIMINYE